jgi:CDP-glucose 4,6-dehydratase
VWRAVSRGEAVKLRNPGATRPWQHVVEPLAGYLGYLQALAERRDVPPALNFGPRPGESATVADVAEALGRALGAETAWTLDHGPKPAEMKLLSLDPSKATASLAWRPRLRCAEAVEWTARWYSDREKGVDPFRLCEAQIEQYEALP